MEGSPYREGKPLSEIIAPDNRRAKTLVLIVASMAVGASLWAFGGRLFADREKPLHVPLAAASFPHVTLSGPDGTKRLPAPTPAVIHVWLQGCADCMPAFEALRDLEASGGLGVTVPIINVSYGAADPVWAGRYRVRENLVFDHGGQNVVRPLGIGTFTTLVIDETGAILHRDRPDAPGYRDRIRTVLGPERLSAYSAPEPDEAFTTASVERVVAAHRSTIRRKCWEASEARASANVTITIAIEPRGAVESTSAEADDSNIARCIETEIRTWRFPPPGSVTTVRVPFKFVRQE
ncbi:MAG: AgmX/PglI C-terminal domain-containing protein [Labilithrix sp.]|nr:AgmX/PglI C-terminal domain-containing protein [Labilithrix sp.]